MASLVEGLLSVNKEGWGPSMQVDENHKFANVPFALFNKNDRLGRVCDWTSMSRHKDRETRFPRRQDRAEPAAAVFSYDAVDEEGFHLVDTRPVPKPKWGPKGRGGGAQGGGRALQAGQRRDARDSQQTTTGGARTGANSQQGARRTLREKDQADRRNWERSKAPRTREFSVTIDEKTWQLQQEIAFSALQTLKHTVTEPEDIITTGTARHFNKQFETVSVKTDKRLTRTCGPPSVSSLIDDPVIQRLANEGEGNVFATDLILSVLMAAPRSVYSWDIVVLRAGKNLFFFSRDEGNLDAITVNETAHELPEDEGVNSAASLDNEAYVINRNFQAQVGADQPTYTAESEDPPASQEEKLYRYRRWRLEMPRASEEDPIEYNTLVVRCEVDNVQAGKDGRENFLTVRTLNEFDPRAKDGVDWRQKIDSQPGAVLAYCLKNNSNKVARYACQALVAGTDLIKIGFVSRVRPQETKQHVILGCKSYKPPEFARQMDVNVENVWGIIKGIVDNCMVLPEGQYVLAKDPNKPIVRLYRVPDDAFEVEEEREENDEDDHDEEED